MTATLTLTNFLLARIAEDEDEARHVGESNPRVKRLRLYGDSVKREVVVSADRVLDECEAKRRIVERFDYVDALGDLLEPAEAMGWYTLLDLAAIWSDHPDYRSEWCA